MTNEKLNIIRIAEEHDSLERKSGQSMADDILPTEQEVSWSKSIYLHPGIKPTSLMSLALAGVFFTTVPLGKVFGITVDGTQAWH